MRNHWLFLASLSLLPATVHAQALPSFIKSQLPAPGATGVARNTSFVFRVDSSGGVGCDSFSIAAPGEMAEGISGVWRQLDRQQYERIFTPTAALLASTTYSATLSCSTGPWKFQFTTGNVIDDAPPRLVSYSPDPTSRTAPPLGPFVFQFDRPLLTPAGALSVFTGDGYPSSFGSFTLSADRTSIAVTLLPEYLVPPVTVIRWNPSGTLSFNNVPGTGPATTVRFLTSLVSSTSGPQVLGSYPEPGASAIPLNARIQILFDRTPLNSSLRNGLVLEARGAPVAVEIQSTGSLVYFTRLTLLPNTTYRLKVTKDLLDADGFAPDAESIIEFTTGSAADPDPSQSVQTSPSGSPAPANAQLVYRSGRKLPALVPLLLKQRGIKSDYSYTILAVADATLTEDNMAVVVRLAQPLRPFTAYQYLSSVLMDITGYSGGNWTFATSDSIDNAPPQLVSSSPSDGEAGIPLDKPFSFLLNEPFGLATPITAVRLTLNGQAVPGRLVYGNQYTRPELNLRTIQFIPTSPLAPSSTYDLELAGIVDYAGNLMPTRKIRFQTAADSTVPSARPALLKSSHDAQFIGPLEPIVFEFSQPLKAGATSATVVIGLDQYSNYLHPVRTEVSGSTVRVVPLLPWPAKLQTNITVQGADRWDRSVSYTAAFTASPGVDTDRPEVLSISPDAGTPITAGQTIRLVFSKPVLSATVQAGGLSVSQLGTSLSPALYWSEDRTALTIVPWNTDVIASTPSPSPLSVVLSSALTDFSGNPAKAFSASYPVVASANQRSVQEILRSWPSRSASLDRNAPVAFYLSRPADADFFNRNVLLATREGIAEGSWQLSTGGRLAVFQPARPWPSDTVVRLTQVADIIQKTYGLNFFTPPAPPSTLTVVRTSFPSSLPANGIIDVEFSQDLPAGPGPLILQTGNWDKTEIPFEEQRPRPNVMRLIPKSALSAGEYLNVRTRPGSGLVWNGWMDTLKPALPASPTTLRYRAPLPDSRRLARNVQVTLQFSADLNPISVTPSTASLSSNGLSLPTSLTVTPGGSLRLAPLAPLPADATVTVRISGVEDLLGRRLNDLAWSFEIEDSIDLQPPSLLYSNASSSMDPSASLAATFDRPLDPTAEAMSWLSGTYQWSFSDDLRTLYLIPPAGWKHGESAPYFGSVRDWNGNQNSGDSLGLRAGFEPDRTPPELRAVSIRDGQTGLPLNPAISLLFTEALSSEAFHSLRLSSPSGHVPLVASPPYASRVTFRPLVPLQPLTRYRLILDGVADSAGNALTSPPDISFTTGEAFTEPDSLVRFSAASANGPLVLRFSQPVDITRVIDRKQLIYTSDSATTNTLYPVLDVAWNQERTELAFTPRAPLNPESAYLVNVGNFSSSAGGRVVSFPSQSALSVTPGRPPALTPNLATIIPADGTDAVPLNVLPQVWFLREPSQFPEIRLYQNGAYVRAPFGRYIGSNTWPNLITLQRALQSNQSYRIEVDAFIDDQGNAIPPTSASFTTSAINAPNYLSLSSSSPAQYEAGVSPDTPWVFTFDQPLSMVNFIGRYPTSTVALPTTYSTSISGRQFTITASPSWPAAATIDYTLMRGNSYYTAPLTSWSGASLAADIYMRFRTAAIHDPTPPVLESISPEPGSTIPGGRSVLTLRFSKPVAIPSGSLQIYYGSTLTQPSSSYYPDPRTLRLTLDAPANSRVTLIGTADIRDNAGNSLAPFVFEFLAGEPLASGGPTCTRTEPKSYEAPPNTPIVVRFNQVMDPATVLPALHITENGISKPGSIEVLEAGRSYRFLASSPYALRATVRIFVLPTAATPDGQQLSDPNGFSDIVYIASSNPTGAGLPLELTTLGFHQTSPADSILEFAMNADLDPASVNGDSVWLRLGSQLVPGHASLRDRRIVQFKPNDPLTPGLTYTLTAGSALRDLYGANFSGQDIAFQAVPPTSAADIESAAEIDLDGRRAILLRFTAPISPLAVHGLSLDQDGTPIAAEAFRTPNGREFVVMPAEPAASGQLHVNLERVPESNGRLLPYRRLPATREARIQ